MARAIRAPGGSAVDALAAVFPALSGEGRRRLSELGTKRSLASGEYLFALGDAAEAISLVIAGRVDLCFPLRFHGLVRDITVESATSGRMLGWSALVHPYRFTLSARAVEASEVAGFARADLLALFARDPELGCAFLTRVTEVMGLRLLTFQALWARGLQQLLPDDLQPTPAEGVRS